MSPSPEPKYIPWKSVEHEQLNELIGREMLVGDKVLCIPSNMPHEAWAIEDTLDLDVFDPPREDWLTKNDSYLRLGR